MVKNWNQGRTGLMALLVVMVWGIGMVRSADGEGMREVPLSDGFDLPVGKPNGEGYYLSRGFTGSHRGEDWNGVGMGNSDLGDPVYSIANGMVTWAGDLRRGYGKTVFILHRYEEDGRIRVVESVYSHLLSMSVKQGDVVDRGQKIGRIGTGNGLYTAHLHFELRRRPGLVVQAGFQNPANFLTDPFDFIAKRRPENAPTLMLVNNRPVVADRDIRMMAARTPNPSVTPVSSVTETVATESRVEAKTVSSPLLVSDAGTKIRPRIASSAVSPAREVSEVEEKAELEVSVQAVETAVQTVAEVTAAPEVSKPEETPAEPTPSASAPSPGPVDPVEPVQTVAAVASEPVVEGTLAGTSREPDTVEVSVQPGVVEVDVDELLAANDVSELKGGTPTVESVAKAALDGAVEKAGQIIQKVSPDPAASPATPGTAIGTVAPGAGF